MYIPRPFQIGDSEAHELLHGIKVGQLVTATSDGPLATLVPWIIDIENNSMIGHISRANPQWKTPWLGSVMVIAEGPNGYVRPGWYETKRETGKVVPTWNYVAVHIYGELIVHDDIDWINSAVHKLTDHHESTRTSPWKVDDAPQDYLDAQLKAIVGVEVKIQRIEVAVKMSQNKTDADAAGVIKGFADEGEAELSDWVRRSTQR